MCNTEAELERLRENMIAFLREREFHPAVEFADRLFKHCRAPIDLPFLTEEQMMESVQALPDATGRRFIAFVNNMERHEEGVITSRNRSASGQHHTSIPEAADQYNEAMEEQIDQDSILEQNNDQQNEVPERPNERKDISQRNSDDQAQEQEQQQQQSQRRGAGIRNQPGTDEASEPASHGSVDEIFGELSHECKEIMKALLSISRKKSRASERNFGELTKVVECVASSLGDCDEEALSSWNDFSTIREEDELRAYVNQIWKDKNSLLQSLEKIAVVRKKGEYNFLAAQLFAMLAVCGREKNRESILSEKHREILVDVIFHRYRTSESEARRHARISALVALLAVRGDKYKWCSTFARDGSMDWALSLKVLTEIIEEGECIGSEREAEAIARVLCHCLIQQGSNDTLDSFYDQIHAFLEKNSSRENTCAVVQTILTCLFCLLIERKEAIFLLGLDGAKEFREFFETLKRSVDTENSHMNESNRSKLAKMLNGYISKSAKKYKERTAAAWVLAALCATGSDLDLRLLFSVLQQRVENDSHRVFIAACTCLLCCFVRKKQNDDSTLKDLSEKDRLSCICEIYIRSAKNHSDVAAANILSILAKNVPSSKTYLRSRKDLINKIRINRSTGDDDIKVAARDLSNNLRSVFFLSNWFSSLPRKWF